MFDKGAETLVFVGVCAVLIGGLFAVSFVGIHQAWYGFIIEPKPPALATVVGFASSVGLMAAGAIAIVCGRLKERGARASW